MSAGRYSIRQPLAPKSFNCFGQRASATPASGRFHKRSRISLELPHSHVCMVQVCVKNANTKLIGQQPGDMSALESPASFKRRAQLAAIKRFSSPQKGRFAEMLLVMGEKSETTQTVQSWFQPHRLLDMHDISA